MIVEAKGLFKKYQKFELKDVDIVLPEGYIMGLIGPNGAGKTTTIKLLMNIVAPDKGDIKLFGMRWNEENEVLIKQRIGYVGEEQPFYDDMSVKWTADLVSKFYPSWDNKTYTDLIKQFDIDENKKVGDLSRGNRVKFALALAMAHKPDLLILDEPTSGLDPVIRRDILKLLAKFIEDGKRSILFSTHITEDLDKVADYIVLINDGQVLVSAEKDDLIAKIKKIHIKTAEFNKLPANLFIAHKNIGDECMAVTADFAAFRRMYKGIADKEPEAYGMDLSDIMLAYVKGEIY